jgi:hypothetical protein
MLIFIKNYDIDNIRCKLFLLYLLNLLDIFFTLFLIKSGLFIEANPIIEHIIYTPDRLIFIKIALPGLLLLYIYMRIKKANKPQLIMSNRIINGAVFSYGALNLMHLIWSISFIL